MRPPPRLPPGLELNFSPEKGRPLWVCGSARKRAESRGGPLAWLARFWGFFRWVRGSPSPTRQDAERTRETDTTNSPPPNSSAGGGGDREVEAPGIASRTVATLRRGTPGPGGAAAISVVCLDLSGQAAQGLQPEAVDEGGERRFRLFFTRHSQTRWPPVRGETPLGVELEGRQGASLDHLAQPHLSHRFAHERRAPAEAGSNKDTAQGT